MATEQSTGGALFDAAVGLDLPRLRHAAGSAPTTQLLTRQPGGVTLVHGLLSSFHFFKAGELSSLLPWPNASRTVYMHDVRSALSRATQPVLRTLLARAPALAKEADEHGATPLHLAARYCLDQLVLVLLRAGGSPTASTGRRTPIDEAMFAGCTEALHLLLGALADSPDEQLAQLTKVAAYSRLPGAALPATALDRIVRRSVPHLLTSRGMRGGGGGKDSWRRAAARAAPFDDTDVAPCAEGGGWDVEAPPSEAERATCQIEQVGAELRPDEYLSRFYDLSRPVLLRGALKLRERCAYAKRAAALAKPWAARNLMRCGRTAYPSLTGQRACGTFTMHSLDRHPVCNDSERTLPVCAIKPFGGVNTSVAFSSLPAQFRYEDSIPAAAALSRVWVRAGARQLFAGGRGSGAAMHFHNPAYNVQLFGVKRWLLTPPRYAGITGAASTSWDTELRTSRILPPGLPLRCAQGPGDMLLLPGHWGHATINSGFAIGIGNLYCDSVNANYTHDPTCRRNFPKAVGKVRQRNDRRSTMSPILLEALGGSFATDGAFPWPSAAAHPSRSMVSTEAAAAGKPVKPSKVEAPRPARPAAVVAPNAAVHADCAKGRPAYRPVAFVHINKAGGTAMRARLYSRARHQLLEATDAASLARMRKLGSRFFHASASLQQRALGSSAWEAAYTFALVRNPYARQVSMFFFLLQEAACNKPIGVRPSHCEYRELPATGSWLRDKPTCIAKFRTWLAKMARKFPPTSREAHLFGARSHGNEVDKWYNASQISWLVDGSGRLLVDEVIRLEDLEAKWPRLQQQICGFAHSPYQEDAELRRNPSSHGHYSEYYDAETRRIVDAYMAADLKAFGYQFEQPPAEVIPSSKGG